MNVFRASKVENIEYENQAKFVQERIITTEDTLAALCSVFGIYLKKACSLRDANDDIATAIFKYSTEEIINKTLKNSLTKLAECLASVGDLRESCVTDIEDKVVKQFLQYNTLCRSTKAEIRSIFSAKENEMRRRRNLGKIRQKDPHNRKLIIKAESQLAKAVDESDHVQCALKERIEIFEKKKILDMKAILMELVMAELRLNAGAIELYTEAYKILMEIDVEDDFQAFQEILQQSPFQSRLNTVKNNMQSVEKTLSPADPISTPQSTPATSFQDSKYSSKLELSDELSDETDNSIEYTKQT